MQHISKATEYNWRRLGSDMDSRLTSRANKTASRRRVVAASYLNDPHCNELLNSLLLLDSPVDDIVYTLCCLSLRQAGIIDAPHVREFLGHHHYQFLPGISVPANLFCDGRDVLGFIYQSLVEEGKRNLSGIYYTNADIVEYLFRHMPIAADAKILDPCCGSGSFLVHCPVSDPNRLYGYDTDPLAVLIASTNLLTKFRDMEFSPRIYCRDFLDHGTFRVHDDAGKFDLIVTNPPWGADRSGTYKNYYPQIGSGERASMTMVEALSQLKGGGRACFVLPLSILTTSAHADIRRYVLRHATIDRLDLFSDRFDGVFTKFFSLELIKSEPNKTQKYTVVNSSGSNEIVIDKDDFDKAEIKINAFSDLRKGVISKVDALCHATLAESRFAMGIVTGDNKRLLLNTPIPGAEPIFTGKDVNSYALTQSNKYIIFDRKSFQQCAPEEYFRTKEKLVYRFIAKYPVVAYDRAGVLTLNSANMIIPEVEGISVKSICALLNSSLYRFYYASKFHDIKVLKKNLCALPFPNLSPSQDRELSSLIEDPQNYDMVDDLVFSTFNISEAEREYIIDELKKV